MGLHKQLVDLYFYIGYTFLLFFQIINYNIIHNIGWSTESVMAGGGRVPLLVVHNKSVGIDEGGHLPGMDNRATRNAIVGS